MTSGCFAFLRAYSTEQVLVALNFTDAPAAFRLPMAANMLLATDPAADLSGRNLHLPATAGVILAA